MTDHTYSDDCIQILELLRERNNVLLSGPPATGKSRLLGELKRAFVEGSGTGASYRPGAYIPLPDQGATAQPWLPSQDRKDRHVFITAFDQSTHQRDVLRGLVPKIAGAGMPLSFSVSEGILYRAAEHALKPNGAALLIIDEINRGPAVAAFGASIVSLEPDKRLDLEGKPTPTTQSFELLDDGGERIDYALPQHLYIVGAMNQADASVAPLDVAFQRRFAPYRLIPHASVLHEHFGLTSNLAGQLPSQEADSKNVYAALVRAWQKVNERLSLGRGAAFQLGHGALMHADAPADLDGALRYATNCWTLTKAHIDEVFFGDLRGVAETISAGVPGSPFTLTSATFAEQPVLQLSPSGELEPHQVYSALKAIAESP
ncbi:AAA family ATPase [Kitasatospora sp. CB02891]|uniref:AAA family ATPase n=1 Tax=Kitasatospora sp. CB02891 TaxID=2020329 RepID=UPI000C27DA3F|nr:AAA family ATPase [Kitasatospora sp. CB02891]PJN22389.1 ATPase [Kitasatospora sp. CB02891]